MYSYDTYGSWHYTDKREMRNGAYIRHGTYSEYESFKNNSDPAIRCGEFTEETKEQRKARIDASKTDEEKAIDKICGNIKKEREIVEKLKEEGFTIDEIKRAIDRTKGNEK